jgi:predicted enzyme related to lactoylglutathione lyase
MPTAVPNGEVGGTEIYLHCDDLPATIERVEAAGVRRLSELAPRDWGDEATYYADLDGNVVVLAKPLASR